ncbi:MAG: type II/IV secretion system ATPase subunit [Nanoarchaeota archaeon]|nr:type II/IV secretion system ATPase subunit [Nanoarchaeota archaeon]
MPDTKLKYDVIREGDDVVLVVDYSNRGRIPSIEDDEITMSETMTMLLENQTATRIIFSQKHDYEYDFSQVTLILELARLYAKLVRNKELFSYPALAQNIAASLLASKYNELHNILFAELKKDPLACYVLLRRIRRREQIQLDKEIDEDLIASLKHYVGLLDYILQLLEGTKLLTVARPYLEGYQVGTRDVYRRIFTPLIKPDFMFTKLMAAYPKNAIELENYTLEGDIEIIVFELPDTVQYLYHVMPPEFKLNEDQYELLDTARKILSEHTPDQDEFTDPARMRDVFYHVGKDLLVELSEYREMNLKDEEVENLAKILVRYTVGFGLIEVLLADENMQDISVNSPAGELPIFIVHADYDDCITNIYPTPSDAESWASKLRLISGRPLDEANPILDTELELPGASIRTSTITKPLDPTGIAFSFRRHRDKPWTLPLFLKYQMITPLAAGLLSFLIDGTRSMLICGTRSSGKSSFLSSLLVEIMRRHRIITIEDTLELPTKSLRQLGFNIQPMKVASALAKSGDEFSAEDGIRSTLRLGDSALIVGEVRSGEAKALYEAMRVGAAANVVAGTIHGDSPFGVFDRLVNDIGIPKTSFKATDIIVIANPIKSADGLHKLRRVLQITEVRKDWQDDPSSEHGFVDLMKYNAATDQLEPTPELLNGESDILKDIASKVKEYTGNWDAMWENIILRGKLKERILELSEKEKMPELLEAAFVILANDMFHKTVERVIKRSGKTDNDLIYFEWDDWLTKEIKRMKLKNGRESI